MTDAVPGPLTAQQRQILDWVGAFTTDNGHPPSYRDIAIGMGIKHHSTAQHHMNSLRRLGWARWIKGRSLSLEFFHPDGTWQTTPPPKIP
jgi:SOS-response transcriptional repressor LexA